MKPFKASAAECVIGLYERWAHAFATERAQILFERPWLDRFIALLPPQGSVLDIGCGTGEPIGRYLVEAERRVTGIDSSPAMIELCKQRLPSGVFLQADMRALSLGRRFDGLLAWNSFFHLAPDDQRRMFPIFRDHAAAGAALMFTSGPRFGEAIGAYHGEPLYHASLGGAEYRALLDANGFEVVDHIVEDQSCGGHTIWLARSR